MDTFNHSNTFHVLGWKIKLLAVPWVNSLFMGSLWGGRQTGNRPSLFVLMSCLLPSTNCYYLYSTYRSAGPDLHVLLLPCNGPCLSQSYPTRQLAPTLPFYLQSLLQVCSRRYSFALLSYMNSLLLCIKQSLRSSIVCTLIQFNG